MKVSFYTLGCKLNFAETSTLSRKFRDAGHEIVPLGAPTDLIVVNSCSVTQAANRKCRQLIGKVSRMAPSARIIVTGCYAQLKPEEVSHLKNVSMVLGIADKFEILERISAMDSENAPVIYPCDADSVTRFNGAYSVHERTRAFLKIQDGCDYRCSYCTVPLARGHSRNAPIEDIVKDAETIVRNGDREIVLTGVNIGDFGKSTGETFYDLLKALSRIDNLERIRISSCEPNLLTSEILQLASSEETKIVPHFHIPLQSGNNRILGLMRRRYRREVFESRIMEIRRMIPHACIGVDVITGFPTETAEDFEDTYSFLESLPLNYLHVFPYSERPGTPAATMEGKVPVPEREERCNHLIGLSQIRRRQLYESSLGQTRRVLVEKIVNGLGQGFTDNYIRTEFPVTDGVRVGDVVNVRLEGYAPESETVTGRLV